MAETYFPFDGGSVAENQWGDMAQFWLNTGVISGQLNLLNVFADSTGMQVKGDTGRAWVQGYYYKNDALKVLSIAAANPTNPRIDRIILRLDWAANTIIMVVLQGTAASSPVPPALTQSTSIWEISLAQVRVDAAVSTIAATKITDERIFVGPKTENVYFYYKGGLQVGIASASTLIKLPIYENQLIKSMHISGDNFLTCEIPGIYKVDFIADLSGLNNQITADLTIRKSIGGNVSNATYESHFTYGWSGLGSNYGSSNQGAVELNHSFIVQLAVSDTLDFFVRCGEAPRNTNGYWISVHKIGNL